MSWSEESLPSRSGSAPADGVITVDNTLTLLKKETGIG
jgi:hypothetical protein